jgi:GDP/UDP-N,N'-diacetylbacillosamine 2-epimerase (hydrolysing)
MKRRICYVTGSRADFGLMERTLRQIAAHPRLDLGLCVTGMHLSRKYGLTVRDVKRSGLPIWARIPVKLTGTTGAEMALGLAAMLRGCIAAFQRIRPDVVLLLGDRGEMLAGALAAVHLNIHVAHVHGGERSGTIDESIRHAVSKLAHFHLTATKQARSRLVRMGEDRVRVFCTGAPGLDGLAAPVRRDRVALCREYGFAPGQAIALVVYHPVVQDATREGKRMAAVLNGVHQTKAQILCLQPNSDAGGANIRATIARLKGKHGIRVVTHMDRPDFVSWLAAADVMVGNSSSGIIEAASLGLPVINIGDRQFGRERSANVTDVPAVAAPVSRAVAAALASGRGKWRNVYGDGRAGERITALLASLTLSQDVLKKINAY